MDFISDRYSAHRTIEKNKILGGILELPAMQHCQFSTMQELEKLEMALDLSI